MAAVSTASHANSARRLSDAASSRPLNSGTTSDAAKVPDTVTSEPPGNSAAARETSSTPSSALAEIDSWRTMPAL